MKQLITKVTQKIADFIIIQLQNCGSDDEFIFWMERGQVLDLYCSNKGIYLN